MTSPSRGSALYAATLATIGAAAAVRFFTTSADAVPVRAVALPTSSPTADAPSSSPTASPDGTALTWGRGAHPTPTPTPSPTTATALPAPRPAPANIATVSGASFTSAGYRQSLQYAIDHRG